MENVYSAYHIYRKHLRILMTNSFNKQIRIILAVKIFVFIIITIPNGNSQETNCSNPENFMDGILCGHDIYKELDGVYYSYQLVDSVPEILQKVFPGIRLMKSTQGIIHTTANYTVIFNYKSYGAYESFNQLTEDIGNSTVSLNDKIFALIYLFEGIHRSIHIVEIEKNPEYNAKIDCSPNFRIRAIVDNHEVIYYLEKSDEKFINLIKQYGSGYSPCLPFL